MTDSARTSFRRRTVLATALAAIGLAGAANAYAGPDLVDLSVVDRETGQVMPVWRHAGRLYIAGEPGARYGLRVTNRTDGRVLVVLSVDGVNVYTGETASYDQSGYVLRARESYDVVGWRKSVTEVAAFAFAPLSQSYAARTGRPGDVGVIGMAAFRELRPVPAPEPPPVVRPYWLGRAERSPSDAARAQVQDRAAPVSPLMAPPSPAPPPPSADAASGALAGWGSETRQEEKLGTAHGAREWSQVILTDFERATRYPQTVRQIEYDTYAHLVECGVIPPPPVYEEHRPRPFPATPEAGFVPDPPGLDP